jgi:D-psicose/D-tagatose/L-ribulose 3-epimerase
MGAAVQAAGSRLRYVHMGESHRGYLGTGSVNFRGGALGQGGAGLLYDCSCNDVCPCGLCT